MPRDKTSAAELLALARQMGIVSTLLHGDAEAALDELLRGGRLTETTLAELEQELAARLARSETPTAPPYDVGEPLGAGGMGQVYRAFDPRLKRAVALKFLWRHDALRAAQEAQAQARVEHAHVCKVYEVGASAGRSFIAMQLVRGQTLLDAAREMTLEQKVTVLRQVAEAVHAAHGLGLVHRDLKPGNVLVERRPDGDWHAYVTDFGLARDLDAPLTLGEGGPVGTPQYMAPEQARAERTLDRRVDVWSLGAILYALLVGHAPFEGSVLEILGKVVDEEPALPRREAPSVPRDLETIALKCLSKAREQRYESALAVAEELGRYLRGEPIRALPLGPVARGWRWVRRRPVYAVVVTLTTAALAVGIGSAVAARRQLAQQAELGERFGREAAQVEGQARTALLLPLHDVRTDRALLSERLRKIEARMAELGENAEGPGHYALGRGALALRRYDEARVLLERAWEIGYRTPDTALALGVRRTYAGTGT